MIKEKYTEAEMEITRFGFLDVITESNPDPEPCAVDGGGCAEDGI